MLLYFLLYDRQRIIKSIMQFEEKYKSDDILNIARNQKVSVVVHLQKRPY